MHLLAATPGIVSDGSEAVDLGQTPADIVVLSSADTELAALSAAQAGMPPEAPSLRLANILQLRHHLSVDLYCENVIKHAKVVVIRLLGGATYWPYGLERISEICNQRGIKFAALPGDDQPDLELARCGTLRTEHEHRLWQYLVQGGTENSNNFVRYAGSLAGVEMEWGEPVPLLNAGLYWPGVLRGDLGDVCSHWTEGNPVAGITFYRALIQAGNTEPIDACVKALLDRSINPLPIYVQSLKDPVSGGVISANFEKIAPDIIINATGFAVSKPGAERTTSPFDTASCPVLQIVFAASTKEHWTTNVSGLIARDIAMNVALPEVDGRVLSRAVAFKSEAAFDSATETSVVKHMPAEDRVKFVVDLAAGWVKLRRKSVSDRRIALILANYPNRDGRIGNGVGLDTPAGTINLLRAMITAGYDVVDQPKTGKELIDRLLAGPTNAAQSTREIKEKIAITDYKTFFSRLPHPVCDAVTKRWGDPENDPFFISTDREPGFISIPAFRCGKIIVGLQPARGYNINPDETYHDPDLVPPHGYFAFYAWLRLRAEVDAVIHMGKHGNLEWLPGKSLSLSKSCYPEAVLGPVPNIYPFIVNDPGEGTQAKRRTSAVIIDHLTPPLARAEIYGPLADLERLVDEYYEASGIDPRRLEPLRDQIIELTRSSGLDLDCGIEVSDPAEQALSKLDNYLCELKEMQIRDGLHIFGKSPTGELLDKLLVALVRLPRSDGKGKNASLMRALASDLDLGPFDPLDCVLGDSWTGSKPVALANKSPWRTNGDTVERLEALALALVGGRPAETSWRCTGAVLDQLFCYIRPSVAACGAAEIHGVISALNGQFVDPGPSGAPTRGRPEVLPTGRNFYSVDTRTIPTPTAWLLGWKSAAILIERHLQEHGEWPARLALSAWGTSNMRTGGDDIAQALALMGVQPNWDKGSGRVTGFEVMPLDVLDRPRVDVTLRLSGFFRDAFPQQIDLFDSAVRAVSQLEEPPEKNPLSYRVKTETARLVAEGLKQEDANRRASYRIFGSKPGAYGAGLQALIDERGWNTDADLARAYIAWGGYAYGSGVHGVAEHRLFEDRLGSIQAVVQNQDNREHDLLDSDDYYQFEGGITAAVRHLSGDQPTVWHNDHSRPETPKIRSLDEEISRVMRARVVNPKWISGVMRHGYKGAFEMAATVDYLFAFAVTAHCVKDHHFDLVYDAYICDEEVYGFLEENNREALKEIAGRLMEAQDRGFWKPRSNTAYRHLVKMKEIA